MSDVTLCKSNTCPLREECRRNASCSDAYPADPLQQWYAEWWAEGEPCYGYVPRHELARMP